MFFSWNLENRLYRLRFEVQKIFLYASLNVPRGGIPQGEKTHLLRKSVPQMCCGSGAISLKLKNTIDILKSMKPLFGPKTR